MGPAALPLPPSHSPGDTGTLFETQLSQLSATLAELRAADRRRDAELRTLRSLVREADERASSLGAALTEIDELLRAGRALLDTPEEPSPTTLFERMRARIGASRIDPRQREVLVELVARMAHVREQVRACLAIEP
jgi:hypothetical protein